MRDEIQTLRARGQSGADFGKSAEVTVACFHFCDLYVRQWPGGGLVSFGNPASLRAADESCVAFFRREHDVVVRRAIFSISA
jgi:hypothetical protein